jgi:hypothetical protein
MRTPKLMNNRRGVIDSYELSSQHFNRDAPVAFMHIPRTSGTSITIGLAATLSPRRPLLHAYDGVLFGNFNPFSVVSPELRRLFYVGSREVPSDADFVAGHVSLSTLKAKYPMFQYITFLREPVSRVLSHWLFFRGMSDDSLREWEPFSDIIRIARAPLREYLSDTRMSSQIDNIYVRMILWPHRLIREDGFIDEKDDEELIIEATSQLDLFVYSDVTENPIFHRRLEAWIGSDILYAHVNETPPIPRLGKPNLQMECCIKALALLKMRTRLDYRLWRALAKRRVEGISPRTLRDYALIQNVVRFATL